MTPVINGRDQRGLAKLILIVAVLALLALVGGCASVTDPGCAPAQPLAGLPAGSTIERCVLPPPCPPGHRCVTVTVRP